MSNLSAIEYIANPSAGTTGLWNQRFSVISANFAALNADVGGLSGSTFSIASGNTLSVLSNVSTGGVWVTRGENVGVGPSSASVMLTITANSNLTDYIKFQDSSGQRSSYILGSHLTNTADGLNLYDASADTMIVSFSKQSIRFYQNVVGPVFNTASDFYNAATFIGSGSSLSGIQAAINQSAIDGVSGVLVPASMYPYDASKISFIYTQQMVREGGDFSKYDIKAYGATGNGVVNDSVAVQQAINSAAANKGIAYIPQGIFRILSKITLPSNVEVAGAGANAVLFFNWFLVSGATSGGDVYLQNANANTSGDTNIRLHDFSIRGDNSAGTPSGAVAYAGGLLLRRGSDIEVSRLGITNIPSISVAYQGVSNARFTNNIVAGSGRDGITGGSYGTWPCTDIVVANNNLGPLGDDGITLNKAVDGTSVGSTRPTRIAIVGNTIYTQLNPGVVNTFGRGIVLVGVEGVTATGNSIASTFAMGIYVDKDASTNSRSQSVVISGNNVFAAGKAGNGTQTPYGIQIANSDFVSVNGNVVSNGTIAGISVQGATNIAIAGNSVVSNGNRPTVDFGIDVSTSVSTGVTISGNVVTKTAGAGIFTNLVQFCDIIGNICLDNGNAGDGTNNAEAGIFMQSSTGIVNIVGNMCTDSKAAGSKLQSYGIRGASVSLSTLFIAHNQVSGNSGQGILITGTPFSILQYGNANYEAGAQVVGWWSPSAFTAGTALLPGMSFASEVSLGWFRSAASIMALSYGTAALSAASMVGGSVAIVPGTAIMPALGFGKSETSLGVYRSGVSTIAMSYGTFNLATQAVRLSMRTLAASAVTASAAKTNVAVDEVVFTVGGASGASLIIYSGGTAYGFNSAFSAAAS